MISRWSLISVVLLIIAGFGGFLIVRAPLFIEADSTKYLVGARFLSQGKGYVEFADGDLILYNRRWPPAYSAFIALGIKAGLSEVQSARFVNFIAWFILLLTWMAFLQRVFRSPLWATVAYFLSVLSWGLWMSISVVLSEPLFMAFLGLAGWALALAIDSETKTIRTKWLVLGALAIMGAGLTRYAGLPFIVATGLALLIAEVNKCEKFKSFLLLMIIAIGGNIAWMLRNRLLTGSATLFTSESFGLPSDLNASKLWHLFWREAVGIPQSWTHYVGWICLLLLGLLVVTLWLRHIQSDEEFGFPFKWLILSLTSYLMMLFVLQAFWSRYFWVLQPFVVAVLVKVVAFLHSQLRQQSLFSLRFCYLVLIVMLLLITITRLRRCVSVTEEVSQRHPVIDSITFEPFAKSKWVFQWVKFNCGDDNLIFSNFPDFIYFVTNCPSWGITENIKEIEEIAQKVKRNRNAYFVLYKDNLWRSYLLSWHEYCRILPHQVLYEDEYVIIARLQLPNRSKE